MKTPFIGLALALAATSLFAQDLPRLAKFDGGIGSQVWALGPLSTGGTGPVNNDVSGIPAGGRPWVIASLKATVDVAGNIEARGKGLLFAGGASVGRTGPVSQVIATLLCGGTPSSSQAAPLDANGDFTIVDTLSPAPTLPCANPTLLIRNGNGNVAGAWFAAGIPRD